MVVMRMGSRLETWRTRSLTVSVVPAFHSGHPNLGKEPTATNWQGKLKAFLLQSFTLFGDLLLLILSFSHIILDAQLLDLLSRHGRYDGIL